MRHSKVKQLAQGHRANKLGDLWGTFLNLSVESKLLLVSYSKMAPTCTCALPQVTFVSCQ